MALSGYDHVSQQFLFGVSTRGVEQASGKKKRLPINDVYLYGTVVQV